MLEGKGERAEGGGKAEGKGERYEREMNERPLSLISPML